MKLFVYLAAAVATFLAISCSGNQSGSGPVSMVYTEPAEMKLVNDSVEALAASMAGQAKFEDYKGVYEYFVGKYPNSTVLHRDYQSLFDGFEKQEEKLAYYKNLYEADPKSAMNAYLYGRALGGMEGQEYFQKSVELDPNYFWGNFGMASAMLGGNPPDTAKALDFYAKAVKADKSIPATYQQVANIYNARGNYDEALKYAKLFGETSPAEYRPVTMQADLLKKLGKENEAEAILVQFATAQKDNPQVRKELVELYKKQGKYAEAITYQHALVALSRQPADAVVDLAKIYSLAGQKDSALTYLNMAADQGFADYRRLSRNDALTPVRELAGFGELISRMKIASETQREQRLAGLMANPEASKAEALAEKLEMPAPAFSYVNLEGKTVSLESLRGKVVVIDFWATWCGPCRMTMPLLQEFVERMPEGVEFISMDVWEDDTTKVRPFLADYGYTFNVLFGNTQATAAYGVTGIPTLVVIDPEGVIRYRHVGYDPSTDQVLIWQTESLLKPGARTQI